jgi:hypothetical protein
VVCCLLQLTSYSRASALAEQLLPLTSTCRGRGRRVRFMPIVRHKLGYPLSNLAWVLEEHKMRTEDIAFMLGVWHASSHLEGVVRGGEHVQAARED